MENICGQHVLHSQKEHHGGIVEPPEYSIQPSIQFTLELEKDGSLPFLNTHLRSKKDDSLNITVYQKTTHTDLYLNFKSHHPIHVRKGLVRCLYDRARKVTTTPAHLQKEEKHLENVLKLNGYPTQFIHVSATPPPRLQLEPQGQQDEVPPLVMLPYISRVSEDIRRVCSRHNLRMVFRPKQTLCMMLSRVKDRLSREKHSKVVYWIPCDCGKVYISETTRRLETRLREHRDVHHKGNTESSAVAEHTWNILHFIQWDNTTIVGQAKGTKELKIMEALHILTTLPDQRLNQDEDLELL